jgi:hypothetical protein
MIQKRAWQSPDEPSWIYRLHHIEDSRDSREGILMVGKIPVVIEAD